MGADKKPFHEAVAHKLIEQLREGTAPWQKPWSAQTKSDLLPFNPVTGNRYKGINALHLMSEGRDDSRWMTYAQAASIDAQVRRGETGTAIQYWKFTEEQSSADATGHVTKVTVELERPRVFFATVFNATQIDGLPPLVHTSQREWEPIEWAEKILAGSGAVLRHGEMDRAFYRPATDSIHLPDPTQFSGADSYYAVALHELGHWTGHHSRLHRDLSHPFGSEGYAREELRAEIASMLLGAQLGIGHDPGQHVAYVGLWIKALQDTPLEIFRAASDAEKIQEYVMGLEQKREQQMETRETVNVSVPASELFLKSANGSATVSEGQVANPSGAGDQKTLGASEQVAGQAAKIMIAVPYREKELAKALGAKWDRQEQSWYVPPYIDVKLFSRWIQPPVHQTRSDAHGAVADPSPEHGHRSVQDRIYLAVAYRDRMEAKAAGAEWDKVARSWYAGERADMGKLARWLPQNVAREQGPAMPPRDEFAEAIRSVGCVVPDGGEHPIMDGKGHRITVEGEKFSKHSGSGFYVGHLDGHPAGYVKNHRTGAEITWKAKGYSLDPAQKALLAAEATANLRRRNAELSEAQEQAARRTATELEKLEPVSVPTSYMRAKGIAPHVGAMTDSDGKNTYLPATDAVGKHWTTQYIQEDGTKRFAKGSRKEGCFHAVGGLEALARAPAIVIAEGYATAAQLKQSLGFATVAAFDAGNLAAVALALRQKFPDKPFVIAGDDDRHVELTQGVNPGRSKAEEAARLVKGTLMLPIFAPGENSYPSDVERFTHEQWREHQHIGNVLSDSQLTALAQMKMFTDFNDLANRSTLGLDGLDRQVRPMVNDMVRGHQVSDTIRQQHQVLAGHGEIGQFEVYANLREPLAPKHRPASLA